MYRPDVISHVAMRSLQKRNPNGAETAHTANQSGPLNRKRRVGVTFQLF